MMFLGLALLAFLAFAPDGFYDSFPVRAFFFCIGCLVLWFFGWLAYSAIA